MSATDERSKILLGIAATVSAIGAAAMMTTPTARADDVGEILTSVEGDFTQANAAFESAFSDFGSGNDAQGFAQLVDGFDDYALSPTYNLAVGTAEALTPGDTISSSYTFGLFVPSDFATGVSLAEGFASEGQTLLADGASALAGGDYAAAISEDILGSDYISVLSVEELFLGAAVSL